MKIILWYESQMWTFNPIDHILEDKCNGHLVVKDVVKTRIFQHGVSVMVDWHRSHTLAKKSPPTLHLVKAASFSTIINCTVLSMGWHILKVYV